MLVLGFNSTHDCSAALIDNGRIDFAIEEERLTRRKHQGGFPTQSIEAILDYRGIKISDLDAVTYYWNPYSGLGKFAWHFVRSLPGSLTYARRQPGVWTEMVGLKRKLRRDYGFKGRFYYVTHHLAHAASSFYPSPFDEAAILTLDGTGEWATTLFAQGRNERISTLGSVNYPHSIGKVYEAVTQYLGYRPMSGEGKVMGLAPYGEPRFLDDFRQILRKTGPMRYEVDTSYFQYQLGKGTKFSPALVKRLGPAREPESELDDRHRDVAASLQARLEELVLELARELREASGMKNLCLAGGVAFNSVMNGRILREAGFDDVFVTPAANDSGAAMGSALWASYHRGGVKERHPYPGAGLGPEFSFELIERALKAAGLKYEQPTDLFQDVAEDLAAGRVVAWFQGRMEYGPRALGNRSLLADPRRSDMKDHLNARVKHREGFRPFAPSVLAEKASEWFVDARPSPYMLKVFSVIESRREQIPAVTHIDGTARVQTVQAEHNPRYHALIAAFEEKTGVPMLLNTSFNVRGQPIVCSPEEAIESFQSTGIDTLVLGDFVIRKGTVD
ncbi:MAG: carbamoyltransferase [Planctomycetota bacterium]